MKIDRHSIASAILAGAFALAPTMVSPRSARAETVVERGRYLVTIMDCAGCHTTGALVGKPEAAGYLAGSAVGWKIPDVGIFYPPNITPDVETGIGAWSEREIITTLRTGKRPDGRELMRIMPWPSYAKLSDADVQAIVTYLKSAPAVRHAVPGPTPLKEVKTPYITVEGP